MTLPFHWSAIAFGLLSLLLICLFILFNLAYADSIFRDLDGWAFDISLTGGGMLIGYFVTASSTYALIHVQGRLRDRTAWLETLSNWTNMYVKRIEEISKAIDQIDEIIGMESEDCDPEDSVVCWHHFRNHITRSAWRAEYFISSLGSQSIPASIVLKGAFVLSEIMEKEREIYIDLRQLKFDADDENVKAENSVTIASKYRDRTILVKKLLEDLSSEITDAENSAR